MGRRSSSSSGHASPLLLGKDQVASPQGDGVDDAAATAPIGAAGEAEREYHRKRFVFGLFLLLLVVVIWVGSSTLIQFIFESEEYNHPFMLTYLSTSLFSLYLLGFLASTQWRCLPHRRSFRERYVLARSLAFPVPSR